MFYLFLENNLQDNNDQKMIEENKHIQPKLSMVNIFSQKK